MPAAAASAAAAVVGDPVDALIEQAEALANEERHGEALALLANSRHADDVRAVWLRADLLRDLGRRHEAVVALREVRERLGAGAVDPAALYELAALERLEGDRESARRTIAQVREVHADAAWTRANAARIDRFDAEVAAGESVRSMSARDLLGNLRGAPEPAERLSALRRILGGPAADDTAIAAARAQAVAIGVGDAAEIVRAAAVAAWQYDRAVAEEFCAAALADPAPIVRCAAIAQACRLPRDRAARAMLRQLAQEADAEVFAQLDAAMRQVLGETTAANGREAFSAAGREACVARWRKRIGIDEVGA